MAEIRDDHTYMMPAHFGGRPEGMGPAIYHDTISATLRYKTDMDLLGHFLPPGFMLSADEVMVSAIMNRGIEWMAGEPYNIVAVNVPVRFASDREQLDGWYSLAVWENKTTPILTGREQTGIPKIYAEVEDFRFLNDHMRTWAHYAGHSFLDLEFAGIREATADQRAQIDQQFSTMNWMAWRYIPNPGPAGGTALSQPTLFPQEFQSTRVRLAEGELSWSVPPVWKNPNQIHIIAALAELRICAPVGPAIIMNAKNILRGDLARLLR